MTYVIAEPCVEECPVEAIYYEDDVPAQWSQYTQINGDFFAELGSPGDASKVGLREHDPLVVKELQPMGGQAQ
jgi:ferredoxin